MTQKIALVGAGLAGISAARTLRGEGYGGELVLIGDESHRPYDRPSLSKSVLSGDEDMPPPLVDPEWLDEFKIAFMSESKVAALDTASCSLTFEDGATLNADRLLLATGARARKLSISGGDLPGVHYLRKVEDSLAMRAAVKSGMSVAVIGGGLIGCEVASTFRKLGAEVTILETADELLLRALGRKLGSWCHRELEAQGIRILCERQVARIAGSGKAEAVILENNESIAADLVVVSIGAEPEIGLALAAGLECDRGIVVDAMGQTSASHIFAAGDAAAWPLRSGGRRSLETYLNAQGEAEVAARAILGRATATPQIPLAWTEMAGHYIQTIGDMDGEGELVLRGDPAAGGHLIFRLVGNRAVAAAAVDAARDFATARRFVEGEMPVTAEGLRNTEINLRDLARAKTGA